SKKALRAAYAYAASARRGRSACKSAAMVQLSLIVQRLANESCTCPVPGRFPAIGGTTTLGAVSNGTSRPTKGISIAYFSRGLPVEDGTVWTVLVGTRTGYQHLSRLLTRAHLRAAKNQCGVRWGGLPEFAQGLVALSGDEGGPLVQAINSPPQGLEQLLGIF